MNASYLELDPHGAGGPAKMSAPENDGLAWTRAQIVPDECILRLGSDELAEVGAIAAHIAAHPLPLLMRDPSEHCIPALIGLMRRVLERLESGPGVAVVDGLPLDELPADTAVAVYWIICQLLGKPVAQKWDGTMLYDVRDMGQPFGYGVRGSRTSVELNFHNDNAFGRVTPQYVALLCLQPAFEGGASRFCSMHAVHEELRRHHAVQLERLYQPFLWDRQAEHAPGEPKVSKGPIFAVRDGRMVVRANNGLIREGYQLAGETMDRAGAAALEVFARTIEDPRFWFELPMQRGQMQFINNRETAHYRSEFVDHDGPTKKRHLIRVWLRSEGGPSYDG